MEISRTAVALFLALRAMEGAAQAPGKWPPDSLINTRVIPKGTSTTQVWGTMRNFTTHLGVTCQYCHVGAADAPLEKIDYASDFRRTKLVARQMMLMLQEINRRIDTIPGGGKLQVTCNTCHRGVARPVPLSQLIADTLLAAGVDAATSRYRALRDRYLGSGAYDFTDYSLNSASFAVARAGRLDEALALLSFNETLFPRSASLWLTRGNVLLRRGDTTAAAEAFRASLRLDPGGEAGGRLRDINRPPARRYP
jgi:hypothetical protein